MSAAKSHKTNIAKLLLFICVNLLSVFICYSCSLSVLDLFLCLLTIAIYFCAFVVTKQFVSGMY